VRGADRQGRTFLRGFHAHFRAARFVCDLPADDITGRGAFTHVSMYQAAIAVADILGQDGPAADYRAVPRVTFTDPQTGPVGLTEAQARQQGLAVRSGNTPAPSSALKLRITSRTGPRW
jgi:pyruvate/2-oxoglutarate dehydrogenase complex dihydrolipoamide dehydrogenase (E3) component